MAKADTKTALLDAAEQQIRMRGADGFSYADLSKAIGIRKASIHYHFPAKSDLLTETMARYSDSVLGMLQNIAEREATAAARLTGFFNIYREALQNCTTLCLCVAYAVSEDSLAQETRNEINKFRVGVIEWLKATFELALEDGSVAGVEDVDMEASSALALAEGAHLGARLNGTLAQYDVAIQTMIARFQK